MMAVLSSLCYDDYIVTTYSVALLLVALRSQSARNGFPPPWPRAGGKMHRHRTVAFVRGSGAGWREIRAILDDLPDAEVVGEIGMAQPALDLVATRQPDLIVTGADTGGADIRALACA